MSKRDWKALTDLTGNRKFRIERVRLADNGVAIEGEFELPHLARLTFEDQTFVAGFLKCHGSIKEMEDLFGISYPTVKSRLQKIADQIDFVEHLPPQTGPKSKSRAAILADLESGQIDANEALKQLNKFGG